MTRARLTVTCTGCGHPFALTERAYAARRARYPDGRLLCQRCLGALWLAGRGRTVADRLLREGAEGADADAETRETPGA